MFQTVVNLYLSIYFSSKKCRYEVKSSL